ncbi:histidine--tRNA ligase, cytoplasmic-like isoform X2 [Aristolochia californica]|uniref:histidine--tRNA ligase, cytoplasmic-like isoform X2 n=1 Tax=Aristolochia californica TaxID=171875 RepID=UPI0035DFC8D8
MPLPQLRSTPRSSKDSHSHNQRSRRILVAQLSAGLRQKILNEVLETVDLASVFDGIAVTKEEKSVVEASLAGLEGILALIDCSASSLVPVIDAVAALSCEAINADPRAFDLPVTGDGFSIKDQTDVASDMRDLLFGSKFVGQNTKDAVTEIPELHGDFRSAVRSVHARARAVLNSKVSGKGQSLVTTVSPLTWAIRTVGEISLQRAKITVDGLDDLLKAQVSELLEKNSVPYFEEIKKGLDTVTAKANSMEFTSVLHDIYGFLLRLRNVLAWEAALALYAFELNDELSGGSENVEKKDEDQNDKKNEKKNVKKTEKKKKVLGKGTTIIRQFLKDVLLIKSKIIHQNQLVLVDWETRLSSLFAPVHPELAALSNIIKEVVESNEVRRLPKIPKGTRDFGKEQMAIRERAFSIIVGVFKRHGGTALDTPVFELRETLMGKYGEDSKLIYDLADQGGEICSLRYDLTVPFARYLAMNKINSLKRYQIAKVYRRDNPSKGRYREFYQCDFDIAGKCDWMEADFEVIKVLTELLDELKIGDYEIKLNHRKLLDGMFAICGVPAEKFRTVCSSIDKLDKLSFEQVKGELIYEKGLAVETVERIGSLVKKRGSPLEILSDLRGDGSPFLDNEGSVKALKELGILFGALESSNCIDKVTFDLSLARGLDYYTGVIFEAIFRGTTQVGSIAAGGRYDNLVKMFGAKEEIPAVGISLGIERVFTIMEEQLAKDNSQVIRATETQTMVVFVGKKGDELTSHAAKLVSELWKVNIKAEYAITNKVMKQIDRAKQSGIPFMVIVGETELRDGVANVKEIAVNKEEAVPRDQVVQELQRRLNLGQSQSHMYVVV